MCGCQGGPGRLTGTTVHSLAHEVPVWTRLLLTPGRGQTRAPCRVDRAPWRPLAASYTHCLGTTVKTLMKCGLCHTLCPPKPPKVSTASWVQIRSLSCSTCSKSKEPGFTCTNHDRNFHRLLLVTPPDPPRHGFLPHVGKSSIQIHGVCSKLRFVPHPSRENRKKKTERRQVSLRIYTSQFVVFCFSKA